MAKKQQKKKNDISGQILVGCLFLGIGFGIWFGNLAVGALLGLGTGFILKSIIDSKRK